MIDCCRISAGQLAQSNHDQIHQIQQRMNGFITKPETNELLERMRKIHSDDVKMIHATLTPLDLTSKLQQMQLDITKRLTGLELIMPCKVDRSELDAIEILCTRLREYDQFRDKCVDDISNISHEIDRLTAESLKNQNHFSAINGKVQYIQKSLDSFSLKNDVSDLKQRVDRVNEIMSTLCPKYLCDEVSLYDISPYPASILVQ